MIFRPLAKNNSFFFLFQINSSNSPSGYYVTELFLVESCYRSIALNIITLEKNNFGECFSQLYSLNYYSLLGLFSSDYYFSLKKRCVEREIITLDAILKNK